MAGINSKALGFGGTENKKKYNGYEQQNKEFCDGSGLEWYDYKNRFYDNQIGRFFCVDKLASEFPYYTPYQFAGNEVPNATDLDGLEPDRDPTRPEYNRTASLSYTNASQASSTNLRNATESRAITQSSTIGPSNKTHWVTEQSNAIKAENQYYQNIQGATMDPIAGQAGMGLALTMKATAELPFDVAEHGNSIVQGVKQGDGWKIAGNAALLVLDVATFGSGKAASKAAVQAEKGIFLVTKEGVVLPQGAKIPGEFVENVHRSSNFGLIQNGKFIEKVRIDPATPSGFKGPNQSHFHLNNGGHIFDGNKWPWR